MDPGLSLTERPYFQLTSKSNEPCSCKKILKFRTWCGHTTGDLVSADGGEHDSVSLRAHVGRNSATGFGRMTAVRDRSSCKAIAVERKCEALLLANIDMAASATSLLFHLGEEGAFIP